MSSAEPVQARRPEGWPSIVYGTAWKGDTTADLTQRAIACGYRAIDTAGQPKHYHEPGVGAGVAAAMGQLGLERGALFLQTKYTPPLGQGRELPYDPKAAPADQVEQSLARSLQNLGTDYLDSYLLHALEGPRGLTDVDWARWRALEALYQRGVVQRIGISNATVMHLAELVKSAEVAPMVVQNRCFARSGWDHETRAFCARHGIAYQGFSLLTANPEVLSHPTVRQQAERLQVTPAQIVFAFAVAVGMIPLTGTTSETHMADDLAAPAIALTEDVVAAIERVG